MGPPGARQQAVGKRQGDPAEGEETRCGGFPQGTGCVMLGEAVGDDDAHN